MPGTIFNSGDIYNAQNPISGGSGGLTFVSTIDTATVDFTGDGTPGNPLSAIAKFTGLYVIRDDASLRTALAGPENEKVGIWLVPNNPFPLKAYLAPGDEYTVNGDILIIHSGLTFANDGPTVSPATRPRFNGVASTSRVQFGGSATIWDVGLNLTGGAELWLTSTNAITAGSTGGLTGGRIFVESSFQGTWQDVVKTPIPSVETINWWTSKREGLDPISPGALTHEGLGYRAQANNYFTNTPGNDINLGPKDYMSRFLRFNLVDAGRQVFFNTALPVGSTRGGQYLIANEGSFPFTAVLTGGATVTVPIGFFGFLYQNSNNNTVTLFPLKPNSLTQTASFQQAEYGVTQCGEVTWTGATATLSVLRANLFGIAGGFLQLQEYQASNMQITIPPGSFTSAFPYVTVFVFRDQSALPFTLEFVPGSITPDQRAARVPLFVLTSNDLTNISGVTYVTQFVANPQRMIRELQDVVGNGHTGFPIIGTANLNINIGTGTIYAPGTVRTNTIMSYLQNTDVQSVGAGNAVGFYYATQTTVGLVSTNNIDPNTYNPSGNTTSAVVANRWTNQLVFLAVDSDPTPLNPNGTLVIIQYGQQEFQNKTDALLALTTVQPIINPTAQRLICIGAITIQQGMTATNLATFTPTDKWGSFGGGGSAGNIPSVTTSTMGRATTYDFYLSEQNLSATSSFGTRVAHWYRLAVSSFIRVERITYFMGQAGGLVRVALYKRAGATGNVSLVWQSGNINSTAGFNQITVGTPGEFSPPNDQLWLGIMVPQAGSGSFTNMAGRNLNLSVIGTNLLNAEAVTIFKQSQASDNFPATFNPVVNVPEFPSIIPHMIASQVT